MTLFPTSAEKRFWLKREKNLIQWIFKAIYKSKLPAKIVIRTVRGNWEHLWTHQIYLYPNAPTSLDLLRIIGSVLLGSPWPSCQCTVVQFPCREWKSEFDFCAASSRSCVIKISLNYPVWWCLLLLRKRCKSRHLCQLLKSACMFNKQTKVYCVECQVKRKANISCLEYSG